MKFYQYFKLLRPKNLFIIGLTQLLLFYKLIYQPFLENDITPMLSFFQMVLISLVTMLVAGAGYVVNDVIDYKIDAINKPDKLIVGRSVTILQGWNFYYATVIIGALLAIYLAYEKDEFQRLWMYPLAVYAMYAYAKYLKCSVLWGNLLVSVFCGGVTMILLYIEKEGWGQLAVVEKNYILFSFVGYSGFAFISNFIREITKDIEDFEGDNNTGCGTMPVVWGIAKSKVVLSIFYVLLFLSFSYWLLGELPPPNRIAYFYVIFLLFVPSIYLFYLNWKAEQTADYKKLSTYCKLLMLSGILYLFVM